MKSGFLVILLISFVSVFSLKAADFHCSGIITPQISHQHDSHGTHHSMQHADHNAAHATHDKSVVTQANEQKTGHADCPPHMHSCCSSVFVFQQVGQISLPQPLETVFLEKSFLQIVSPILEGPFQPPRLS